MTKVSMGNDFQGITFGVFILFSRLQGAAGRFIVQLPEQLKQGDNLCGLNVITGKGDHS
jgi:hypothetical protein